MHFPHGRKEPCIHCVLFFKVFCLTTVQTLILKYVLVGNQFLPALMLLILTPAKYACLYSTEVPLRQTLHCWLKL